MEDYLEDDLLVLEDEIKLNAEISKDDDNEAIKCIRLNTLQKILNKYFKTKKIDLKL